MSSGNIGKIKASRVNNVQSVDSYIGEKGILFFNFANGVIRLSDGITPGGVPIPYTIASNTTIGGIKSGPGIVISNEGELYIDTANLALSFGNFTADNNVLTITNVDQDMILQTQGNAEIQLIGNVGFYKPDGLPPSQSNRFAYFSDDGRVDIRVSTTDTVGAIEIIGTSTGNIILPGQPGSMLHITGQIDLPTRIYYDGNGSYNSWVARRWNGSVATPTQVLANEDVLRINGTAATDLGMGNVSFAQIAITSLENQTSTTQGSEITFVVTPVGSSAVNRVQVANISFANGVNASKFTTSGNLTAAGNVTGGNIITTGTVTATGNISGGNLALSTGGIISASGLITTTSNIAGGNILSTGSLSVTGNITAGNVNSYVALPAGTSSKAPLTFAAGTILNAPSPGAVNYDGRIFYATPQGQERGLIKTVQAYILNANYALLNQTGIQSLFGASVSLSSNTRYAYSITAIIYKTANNITMSYATDGVITLASHNYQTTTTATATLATLSSASVLKNSITSDFTTPVVVTAALNGAGYYSLQVNGILNVTTGGTWRPVIAFSGLPGAGSYVSATSSIEIYPVGATNANVSIGSWA